MESEHKAAEAWREMSAAEYDAGWDTQWDDMKQYGPFSRHLRRLIMELIRPLKFKSVLDVGCGQGAFLSDLMSEFPGIEPYGVDISAAGLKLAQKRVPNGVFSTLDLTHDSLGKKFDLVICSEVLEHIAADEVAIQNIVAMMQGFLVVSSPQGRMREFEKTVGHVRNYAYGELDAKLRAAGLDVERVVEWGFPFYSPLYRDWLNLSGGRGTTGSYSNSRKLLASLVYWLFALNSSRRGDEIVILARIKSA